MEYTPQERRFSILLVCYAILFLLAAVVMGYHAVADRHERALHLFFCAASVCLALASRIASKGVRRNGIFSDLLQTFFFLLFILGVVQICRKGFSGGENVYAIVHVCVGLAFFLLTYAFWRSAVVSRFGLRQLSPTQALSYRAIAEAVIGGAKAEDVSYDALVSGFDDYLNRFESPMKRSVKLVYWAMQFVPLIYLNVPLTWMGVEERTGFLRRRFERATGMLLTLMRSAKQLVYFVYYGSKPSFRSTGYVLFEERERYKQLPPEPEPEPLDVRTVRRPETVTTDICVIGSGAAGAVAAYNLARLTGKKVTILERGKYYLPQRDFTNIEPQMIGSLYRDGGLEMTQDYDLAVLQGNCLGGSTTMNNGICFRTPPAVLQLWETLGAPVDSARLERAFGDVERIIGAKPLAAGLANGGAKRFFSGAEKLGLGPEWFVTNFGECGGAGYCNIGCKYNRKLSMLLNYLPMAQKLGVDIITEAEVLKIDMEGERAGRIFCSALDGTRFTVQARQVVVAAGAIASSGILLKSGLKQNVGTRLSFNITTPMMAEFPEEINSFDGVQMCCYIKGEGYLVETTFNPPGASALIMQGWFEQLTGRMARYRHFATAAPVVPSEPNGAVKRNIFGDTVVDYSLTPGDFARLKAGMKALSRIWLADGALRVLPSSYGDIVISSEADLGLIDSRITEPHEISLSSAHPQGGNPMSDNREIGAVGTDFRVHGTKNLYVCDASIFPTGVTVNPQLSIMGLAHYAAESIASGM